jgi:hypothetical protein
MSQPVPTPSSRDQVVARAVVDHHALLAAGVAERVAAVLDLVAADALLKADQARRDLVAYLRRELLPHARAEEEAMYPAAANQPDGALLIAGMLQEHRALTELVDELGETDSPVRAAAAARAVASLFAVHLEKENDLVLPLLVASPDVSLADLVDGLHDLLGAAATGAAATGSADAGPAGGCGCGGCGCGGDRVAEVASRDVPVDV